MYGCENKHAPPPAADPPASPAPNYSATSATRLAERVFPFLVSKAAPDAFSFADCNFRVQKSKESTARVVGWRELGLLNSLTLEASFAGPSKGRLAFHVSFGASPVFFLWSGLFRFLIKAFSASCSSVYVSMLLLKRLRWKGLRGCDVLPILPAARGVVYWAVERAPSFLRKINSRLSLCLYGSVAFCFG